jgi:hypothetical protein
MNRFSACLRQDITSRRSFLSATAAALTAGLGASLLGGDATAAEASTSPNVLGPRPGYSPMIGTFISQLTWMREVNGVLTATKGLTQANLDTLFDADANTIGALMLHLAATETYYGLHTFEGMKWGSWPDEVKKKWDAAMKLDEVGRITIKGHERDHYVRILQGVRENTLAQFRKKDDAWLMAVDKDWPWGPTNNLCKWFHVCEHEANHTGQIALLRKRLPGAKTSNKR